MGPFQVCAGSIGYRLHDTRARKGRVKVMKGKLSILHPRGWRREHHPLGIRVDRDSGRQA
jgi:hypothetical protein